MNTRLNVYCIILLLILTGVITGCQNTEQAGIYSEVITEPKSAGQDAEDDTKAELNTGVAEDPDLAENPSEAPSTDSTVETGTMCVHVCGAVNSPGVYQIPQGSRLYQAVEAAGGFRKDAADSFLNQAMQICDGQKIVILTMEEAEALTAEQIDDTETGVVNGLVQAGTTDTGQRETVSVTAEDGKININTAQAEELTNINGIGMSRAEAIVAYRTEHGPFSNPEDIMNVTGIKEGLYQKMKDQIKVK